MYNDCPECKKETRNLNSRINHLENAKWSYEAQKGKGSFAKRNPGADKLLTSLLDKKVQLAVEHVKHMEDQPEAGLDSPAVASY